MAKPKKSKALRWMVLPIEDAKAFEAMADGAERSGTPVSITPDTARKIAHTIRYAHQRRKK